MFLKKSFFQTIMSIKSLIFGLFRDMAAPTRLLETRLSMWRVPRELSLLWEPSPLTLRIVPGMTMLRFHVETSTFGSDR